MKDQIFKIEEIYIPTKRRKSLNKSKVNEIAESILENGQKIPIQVRIDNKRFILVEGYHRLEACRSLGEETIVGIIVQAKRR